MGHRNKLKKSSGEQEIIHFHMFDPRNTLFKQPASARSECQIITCTRKDDCEVYSRGECIINGGLFGGHCPYGRKTRQAGFTRKARKYHGWMNEKRKQYEGIPYLNTPTKKIAVIGEYIYLPYPFLDMNKGLALEGNCLLASEFKTQEHINTILFFHPRALFTGGEIPDYQEKSIPSFKQHLQECMPEVYKEFIGEFQEPASNVGRHAYVSSLRDGVVLQKKKKDTTYTLKDGWLVSTNHKELFAFVEYDELELRMKPKTDAVVEITNDDQVDANTRYKD